MKALKKGFPQLHLLLREGAESLMEFILHLFSSLFLLVAIWGPVSMIWVDIIDKRFSLFKSIGLIGLGLIIFYLSLGLADVLKRLDGEGG